MENNPDKFRVKNFENDVDLSHLRWTLDLPSDLKFTQEVYKRLYRDGKVFLMNEVVVLLDQEPELIKINSGIERNSGYLKSLGNDKREIKQKRKSITTEFEIGEWERPFIEHFGEEYLAYRRAWDKAGPDWIPEFPLHIDFQLRDECNMRCRFCPRDKTVMEAMNATDLLNKGTTQSLETFKQVIDEGSRYKLRAINLGATSEPLIHPNVVEMVQYAREKGVYDIRMITNGLLLEEKMIHRLYDAGLTYLGISVDAFSQEAYKKVRRVKMDRVVNHALLASKIRNERKLDFPRIRVSFVNSPEASHEFPQFLEFWKDKVDFVERQDYNDFKGVTCNTTFTCSEPYRRLMVWASGIVSCIAWTAERYPYGHIHGKSIKECWDSEALKNLRESFRTRKLESMCLGCYGKMPTKN